MRWLAHFSNPFVTVNLFTFTTNNPHLEIPTQFTKHNPTGIKDLRGYERL